MSIAFDPRDPDFRRNPYPYYDLLRTHAPIFFWEPWQLTFFSSYEDCSALLRDNRFGRGGRQEPPPEQAALDQMMSNWMLMLNPPDHTRLRGLVHKAFSPRMVEQLRGATRAITDELLDRVQPQGEMDLIADLAYPLPVTVIATMLGIPTADRDRFHAWSDALARSLDLTEEAAVYNRASVAAAEFTEYLRGLVASRRAQPSKDLVSALVAVEEAGEQLTEAELFGTCALLLVAGHETTINLIGNGALALLRNPEQLRLLQQQPNLARTAIEELLRFDGPVQMTGRTVLEDLTYKGRRFARGQEVALLLGAANYDPAVFNDPHRLDITREKNPHLTFGGGIHYCIGAPLARLEGQIAFETLLRRLPNLRLADDNPRYRDNFVLRGLEALPLEFS